MAEDKQLKPKGPGHSIYHFNQDYPLGGKKKGDAISLARVPIHLRHLLVETAPKKKVKEPVGERPTGKTNKDDIVAWLIENGISASETNGLSKDDLLDLVQQVK